MSMHRHKVQIAVAQDNSSIEDNFVYFLETVMLQGVLGMLRLRSAQDITEEEVMALGWHLCENNACFLQHSEEAACLGFTTEDSPSSLTFRGNCGF